MKRTIRGVLISRVTLTVRRPLKVRGTPDALRGALQFRGETLTPDAQKAPGIQRP